MRRICAAAASASSPRPWPTLTFHSPDSPSMYSRPSASRSIAPLPLDNDQRLPVVVGVMQRVNEIAPIGFEQLRGAVHITSYPPSARPVPLPRPRRNALRFWPARSRLLRQARGTGQPPWPGPLTPRLGDRGAKRW